MFITVRRVLPLQLIVVIGGGGGGGGAFKKKNLKETARVF